MPVSDDRDRRIEPPAGLREGDLMFTQDRVCVGFDPAGDTAVVYDPLEGLRTAGELAGQAQVTMASMGGRIQQMIDQLQVFIDQMTPENRATFDRIRDRIRRDTEQHPGRALISAGYGAGSGVQQAMREAADAEARHNRMAALGMPPHHSREQTIAWAYEQGLLDEAYARRLYAQSTAWHQTPASPDISFEMEVEMPLADPWLPYEQRRARLAVNDRLIEETRATFPRDPHQYGYPGSEPMSWSPAEAENDETRRAHP